MTVPTNEFPRETAGLPAASATDGRRALRRRPVRAAHRAGDQAHRRRDGADARLQRLHPRPDAAGARRGRRSLVDVENEGDMEATVHWHGLRLENRFDGTHETQEAMPVGGRYTARVAFPDPGVYWYHPHIREDYGQEMGLYGNVIVVPSDPDYWPPVQPRARAHARRRPHRGRPGRGVQPRRDDVRGDGALRQRAAGRRRARARADRASRRGRAPVPDEHRQHPRVQGRAARRADEARRRRQRPRRARAVRRGRRAGAVRARRRRRAVPRRPASWRWSTARPTGPTRSRDITVTEDAGDAVARRGVRGPAHRPRARRAERERLAPLLDAPPDKTLAFVAEMDMGEPDVGAGGALVYACPMHPEVVSDEPGPLPRVRDEAHRRGRTDRLRLPDAPGGHQRDRRPLPEVRHEAHPGAARPSASRRARARPRRGTTHGTPRAP